MEGAGRERFMLFDPDRVLYAGLLGKPTLRSLGSASVYVSLAGSLEVQIAGEAVRRGEIAIVPPYTPHHVRAEDRSIACLLVEPESVGPQVLGRLYALTDDPARSREIAGRTREACSSAKVLCGGGLAGSDLDERLLGTRLEGRTLDRRISLAISRLQAAPSRPVSGLACARSVDLSLSRFLHLFKSETGVTFKRYRAWRRARTMLAHANRKTNLTHLALDLGYPDATHFSHSVRRMFGLQPSEIFAGSRRLHIAHTAGCSAAALDA